MSLDNSTLLLGVCEELADFQAHRPPATEAYIGITWFLYVGNIMLWVISMPFLWHYREHSRLRAVRPFMLSTCTSISGAIWPWCCLNLVIMNFPCAMVPMSIIIGISGNAINFSVRLIVFAIESQFAKNAHLFKANRDSDTRSDDSMLAVAPYMRSIRSLCRLLAGFTTLDKLEISEIARAKKSTVSLTMMALIPGVIAYFCVVASDWELYFYCTQCMMNVDALVGFLCVTAVYAVITGRIIFVLWKADFPDDQGILYELRMCYLYSGLPLLPITILWIVDANDAERDRAFAYEWLVMLDMAVFWWFTVGAQLREIRSRNRKTASRSLHHSTSSTPQLSNEDLRNPGFEAYMVRQLAVENLYFLQDVAAYKQYFMEKGDSWRKQKSHIIYSTYVRVGGAMELNISDSMRRRVGQQIAAMDREDTELEFVFDVVVNEVRNSIACPLWADYEYKEIKRGKNGQQLTARVGVL